MSNKTPKNNTEKIELAPKRPNKPHLTSRIVVGIILVVLLTTLFWLVILGQQKLQEHKPCLRKLNSSECIVRLDFALDQASQEKGLGNRNSLPNNEGMMFVFESEGDRCFWMKDMKFNLDILWLNKEKKIVHIEPKVSPSSYPTSFCPSSPAQYVLEINADRAQKLGLSEGQQLSF